MRLDISRRSMWRQAIGLTVAYVFAIQTVLTALVATQHTFTPADDAFSILCLNTTDSGDTGTGPAHEPGKPATPGMQCAICASAMAHHAVVLPAAVFLAPAASIVVTLPDVETRAASGKPQSPRLSQGPPATV